MARAPADGKGSKQTRLFLAAEGYVPPLKWLTTNLNGLPPRRVDGVFWFQSLLGTLPALRAGQLFPFDWVGAAMRIFRSTVT